MIKSFYTFMLVVSFVFSGCEMNFGSSKISEKGNSLLQKNIEKQQKCAVTNEIYDSKSKSCKSCPSGLFFNSSTFSCISDSTSNEIRNGQINCAKTNQIYDVNSKGCSSCSSGQIFSPSTYSCLTKTLTAADCNAINQILSSNQCVTCESLGKTYSNGNCISTVITKESCDKLGQGFDSSFPKCYDCSGINKVYSSTAFGCVDKSKTAAECLAINQVLIGTTCQACSGGKVTSDGLTCQSTAATCLSLNQILVNGSCTACGVDKITTDGLVCKPRPVTKEDCLAQTKILVNGACQACDSSKTTKDGLNCVDKTDNTTLASPGLTVTASRTAFTLKIDRPANDTNSFSYTVYRAITSSATEAKVYGAVAELAYGGAAGTATLTFEKVDAQSDKNKFFSYYVEALRVSDNRKSVSTKVENKKLEADPIQAPIKNLTANRLINTIKLTWVSPNATSIEMNYYVRRTKIDGTSEKVFPVSNYAFLDDNQELEEGNSYYYYIKTSEKSNDTLRSEEVKSAKVDFLKSNCPGFSLQALPDVERIYTTWVVSDIQTNYNFKLYRSIDGGVFGTSEISTNASAFDDVGLDPNKTYKYKITCVPKSASGSTPTEVLSDVIKPKSKPTAYEFDWQQIQNVDLPAACAKGLAISLGELNSVYATICDGASTKNNIKQLNSENDLVTALKLNDRSVANSGDGLDQSPLILFIKLTLTDADSSVGRILNWIKKVHSTGGWMRPLKSVKSIAELKLFYESYLCGLYKEDLTEPQKEYCNGVDFSTNDSFISAVKAKNIVNPLNIAASPLMSAIDSVLFKRSGRASNVQYSPLAQYGKTFGDNKFWYDAYWNLKKAILDELSKDFKPDQCDLPKYINPSNFKCECYGSSTEEPQTVSGAFEKICVLDDSKGYVGEEWLYDVDPNTHKATRKKDIE